MAAACDAADPDAVCVNIEDGFFQIVEIAQDSADLGATTGPLPIGPPPISVQGLPAERTYIGGAGDVSTLVALDPATTVNNGMEEYTFGGHGGRSRTCVITGGDRDGFVSFKPTYIEASSNRYYMSFINHYYKQNRARSLYIDGTYQKSKQFEHCSVGGAITKNGYKLNRVFVSKTMATSARVRLGSNWDTYSGDGQANATLSFNAGAGAFTIGGSTPVGGGDEMGGGNGPYEPSNDKLNSFAHNQTTAYWKSGNTWRWDGSTSWQGNVGHVLYELPQGAKNPNFLTDAKVRMHCGRAFGAC